MNNNGNDLTYSVFVRSIFTNHIFVTTIPITVISIRSYYHLIGLLEDGYPAQIHSSKFGNEMMPAVSPGHNSPAGFEPQDNAPTNNFTEVSYNLILI